MVWIPQLSIAQIENKLPNKQTNKCCNLAHGRSEEVIRFEIRNRRIGDIRARRILSSYFTSQISSFISDDEQLVVKSQA